MDEHHGIDNHHYCCYHQMKKDKQEFTVKMREGDSFLMPQVKLIIMIEIMISLINTI